jgi:ribonuclease BN (tRNA processing enzyme)
VNLTVVGCSPAWPNPGGAHSGYLVDGSGTVLLDCGPGVLGRLRGVDKWPTVKAVVITHFHLDHWGDLVPWVWGALYLNGRAHALPRPQLWVPPAGRAQLEHFGSLLGFPDMFDRVFEVSEYEVQVPFAVEGYSVTAVRVPHYTLAAHALRISDGDRLLAYSGDAGPGPEVVEAGRDADLFLCEATLAHGDLDGQPRGHLSVEEAEAAYEESGARALLLTHRPTELPAPKGRRLAYDGLVVPV